MLQLHMQQAVREVRALDHDVVGEDEAALEGTTGDAAMEEAAPVLRLRLRPADSVRSRFYLRLLVEDRPGVLAEVAGVLARHEISVASVIQHEVPDLPQEQRVHLVIMTHGASTARFRASGSGNSRL